VGLRGKNVLGIIIALIGAILVIIAVPNWIWFIALGGLCIAFGWTLFRAM